MKCTARTISTMGQTYTPDVKHGDVVEVGAERDPVNVRRRDPVLDLHRPLVHDQHGARGDDEKDGHKLKVRSWCCTSELLPRKIKFLGHQSTEVSQSYGYVRLVPSHLIC